METRSENKLRSHSTAGHAIGSVTKIGKPRRTVANCAAQIASPANNAITAASSTRGPAARMGLTPAK